MPDESHAAEHCLYRGYCVTLEPRLPLFKIFYLIGFYLEAFSILQVLTLHTTCIVYSLPVCEVKLSSESFIGAKDNGCNENHSVMEPSHIAKQVPNSVFGSFLHPCVAIQVQLDVPLNPIVMMLVLLVNELFRLHRA